MKKTFLKLAFVGLLAPSILYSQTKEKQAQVEKVLFEKPYNENEDAYKKIQELTKQAQQENKNIILQVGGNWCIWCLRFNHFITHTPEIKQILDENFIYYHLNFSPKNKNEEVFAKYGDEGKKLGYPYFIVLDKNGNKLYSQESGSLEEGKSYSTEKVKEFFQSWIPKK